MVLVRVLGIEVRYNSIKALEDISIEVLEGEVVAIIGPNGSGKTTLLKTIDGIIRPFKGSVYIDMKEVSTISRRELAKLIGFVPQIMNIQHGFRVIDFVLTGRRPYIELVPRSFDVEVALSALKAVNAEHLVGRDITELSSGELQRVIIARALAAEPKVLLLDEPTSNLDLRFQVEIMKLIKELSIRRSVTTIMALHDLTHAYRYSDKVLVLNGGKVYGVGKPEEVLTKEVIKAVYGVDAEVLSDLRAVVPLG